MQTETKRLNIEFKNEEKTSFRYWLQRQFAERCKKNPRYSLRAFARFLSMDPSSLSQILSGKRSVSKKKIQLICQRISVQEQDLLFLGLMDRDVLNDLE